MSPLSKGAVDASLLEVVRHFAGPPIGEPAEAPDGKTRVTHRCPSCDKPTLSAVVYPDADPPGSGVAGCSEPACDVPKRAGALALICHFRGLAGKGKTAAALACAAEFLIAEGDPSQEQLPLLSGGVAPGQPSPQPPSQIQRAPQPEIDAQAPTTVRPDGELPLSWAAPEPPHGREPAAASAAATLAAAGERNPEGESLEKALDQRDRVYAALLALCPADERLLSFFEGLGVSEGVVRGGRFGLYRHEEASPLLAELVHRFGTETLLSVGGFSPPAGSSLHALATGRGPRLSLGAEDAALVPYTDRRGRVTAIELIPLSDPDSARLMGADDAGRDPLLGGTNHFWVPCPPADVEAVTDCLPEAMRAASAGLRCAAIRSPQAFRGPTGQDGQGVARRMPELLGVRLAARRVVYAPGPSRRARASAPPAARNLICRLGTTALVVGAPPYGTSGETDGGPWSGRAGLGSYLLSLGGHEASRAAFEMLFDERHSTPISPEASPAETGPADPMSAQVDGREPGISRAAFERELARRPRKPPKNPAYSASEAGHGLMAGIGAFLLLYPPTLLLLGPLAANLSVILAAGREPPRPDLSDPPAMLLALLANAADALLSPLAQPLIPVASVLQSVAGAAALCAVPAAVAGLLYARRCRRFRFRRREILDGRVMGSRVLIPWHQRLRTHLRTAARRGRLRASSRLPGARGTGRSAARAGAPVPRREKTTEGRRGAP